MTTPAIIDLTFDATSVQLDDLQVFVEIAKGLFEPPSVRGTDTIIPGLGGRIEGNRVNDVLAIDLRAQVQADPDATDSDDARASFWTNYLGLRTLFAPNRLRANLVATLPDGSTATISAQPLNIVTVREIASVYWTGLIELQGFDDWVFEAAVS